ncbi:MAG: Uncharacterised protein [Halieaceae bacterium]|nr:MAG: Uncharacterised protein [Halieaceae bacterium]
MSMRKIPTVAPYFSWIFAAVIMPCTKPSGEEELACQRNTSSLSAVATLVKPARQHTATQRMIAFISSLLIVIYDQPDYSHLFSRLTTQFTTLNVKVT